MGAKVTNVTLRIEATDVTKKFEISHAERILRMKHSGWVLEDKKFEFKNGTINRASKGGDSVKTEG